MYKTKVTLHDYEAHPSLPQKDGANHAHQEIASLLLNHDHDDLVAWPHDFTRLLKDHDYSRFVLSDCDCVISNVGPHAHYYFYLREKLGYKFRIIRDARTALWSSYLLQESLSAALCRNDDTLLVATNFTHGIYRKAFPSLLHSKIIRCYPLVGHFPKDLAQLTRERNCEAEETHSGVYTIGYLGRISKDKGFAELLEALIELNTISCSSRRCRLLACGTVSDYEFSEKDIHSFLRKEGVDSSLYTYLGSVSKTEIWDIMKLFDLLVFPSVSSLETMGRVVLEASYMGLPILASEHAAGTELLRDNDCLLHVDYYHGETFHTHFHQKIGAVTASAIADGIRHHSLQPNNCWKMYKDDAMILKHAIHGHLSSTPLLLTDQQAAFIDRLKVDIGRFWNKDQSLAEIERLCTVFTTLNDKLDTARMAQLHKQLLACSISPKKTVAYISSRNMQYDFSDIGGLDIEVCNLLGYHPTFTV